MIELECKTDGCDAVIPCDEGVVSVKCGICSMYNADASERESTMFDYFNQGEAMLVDILIYNPFAWFVYLFLFLIVLSFMTIDDEDM